MPRSARTRAGLPVYLLAAVIVVLGGLHIAIDDDPLVFELAEAAILWVVGAATGLVGWRLDRWDASREESFRVVLFVLGGGLSVGLLAAAFVAIRLLTGEATPEREFILFTGWSVGAAAGAWTGYYFVHVEASLAEQRELNKRLTVLQRVLRHNLRNEISVIGGASRDLRARVDDPEAVEKADVVLAHVREVSKLSERSGTLTRIWRTDGDATVDLGAVVDRAVARVGERHPDVPLAVDDGDGFRVVAHSSIDLAIEEGMRNAAVHNEDVEVTLAVRERDAHTVTVEITDTGSGIPESELRPLWTPGEGPLSHTSGLGLWLIYWLVDASGGDLEIESDAGGTTLAMTFRRA